MYNSKKGIVTITTFSLIIIVSFLVLSFSFFFNNLTVDRANEYNSRVELITSTNLLRSELLSLVQYENSSILYNSTLDSAQIIMELNRNYIYAFIYGDRRLIISNVSTLGVRFCSRYDYSPAQVGNFSYNGDCITLN